MATKKIVLNRTLNKFAHEYITQIFKPQWGTKTPNTIESYSNVLIEPVPAYSPQANLDNALSIAKFSLPGETGKHIYSDWNGVSSAFIVTENWFEFLNLLTEKLDSLNESEGTTTFVHWVKDSVTGAIDSSQVFVDDLAKEFHGMDIIEGINKNDARYESQELLEFFLRHAYSLNMEARNLAITAFGERFNISGTTIEKAKKAIYAFENFDSDKIVSNISDEGLLSLTYPDPIKLERRFSKEELANDGIIVDKVYLMFPTIQSGLVSGYVPAFNFAKQSGLGTLTDNNGNVTEYLKAPSFSDKYYSAKASQTAGREIFKRVAPYIALSLGSVAENAVATTPYDVIVDHTDIIDYKKTKDNYYIMERIIPSISIQDFETYLITRKLENRFQSSFVKNLKGINTNSFITNLDVAYKELREELYNIYRLSEMTIDKAKNNVIIIDYNKETGKFKFGLIDFFGIRSRSF